MGNKFLLTISQIPEMVEKYSEFKDLKKTSEYFGVSIETLRKFFIKNNISYIKKSKYSCNHNAFSEDTEDSFYWAGFLAADGNVSKKGNRIYLGLKATDFKHIEKFNNFLKSNNEIKYLTSIDTRPAFKTGIYFTAKVRIISPQIKKDLLKFNIYPNKSKTYFLPDEIINHISFNNFIRGMIDGDGHISHEMNHGSINLYGTPKVTKQIFTFLKNKLELESGNLSIRKDGLGSFHFKKLADLQKIINYLDYSKVSLDRKKIVAIAIANSIPAKLNISKEVLKDCKNFSDIYRLSKELEVSTSVIRRRMEEFNIDFIPQIIQTKLKLVTKEQLIKDFKSMSLCEIAKKYKVVVGTLRKHCNKLNINYKEFLFKNNVLTEEVIKNAYNQFKSIKGVARHLKIDRETSKKYLLKYNIIS